MFFLHTVNVILASIRYPINTMACKGQLLHESIKYTV
jgi:hypothetical protein